MYNFGTYIIMLLSYVLPICISYMHCLVLLPITNIKYLMYLSPIYNMIYYLLLSMLHTVLLPVIILFFKSYWDYTAKLAPIDITHYIVYCIIMYTIQNTARDLISVFIFMTKNNNFIIVHIFYINKYLISKYFLKCVYFIT